jgi:hypothetical protein
MHLIITRSSQVVVIDTDTVFKTPPKKRDSFDRFFNRFQGDRSVKVSNIL